MYYLKEEPFIDQWEAHFKPFYWSSNKTWKNNFFGLWCFFMNVSINLYKGLTFTRQMFTGTTVKRYSHNKTTIFFLLLRFQSPQNVRLFNWVERKGSEPLPKPSPLGWPNMHFDSNWYPERNLFHVKIEKNIDNLLCRYVLILWIFSFSYVWVVCWPWVFLFFCILPSLQLLLQLVSFDAICLHPEFCTQNQFQLSKNVCCLT